jgi:cobyrinic acid a,c-diamide synthase
VAGKRHEEKVRTNIEKYCHIPVFGAIPKLNQDDFPERHMGLLTSDEHAQADHAIQAAINVAQSHIDLKALYETLIQNRLPVISQHTDPFSEQMTDISSKSLPVTIGIIRDSAFQFYYPDNIEALKNRGAHIIYISPLTQTTIPKVDAIYMGGGFPETHARKLADNTEFKNQFKALSLAGLPIYAECGGLIYLGEHIRLDGIIYPMTGIFPMTFGLSRKPVGHGYTQVKVVNNNPFFTPGEVLKGHEFRYSKILHIDYSDDQMAFRMERGKGITDKKDGFFMYNTFGTYTHLHALGCPAWADAFIKQAISYQLTQ